MTFGQKVRKMRMARGLSTAELGKLSGLSQQAISAYETGIRPNPIPVAKMALASALKCKPSDLDDDLCDLCEIKKEENNK